MKIPSLAAASLVLCFTAGCSGCGDDKNGNVDASTDVDAVDASACTAPSSFTTVTNIALTYTADRDTVTAGNQEVWKAIGDMDAAAKRDWLWIELFEGAAPEYTTLDFPATPFTIQISNDETNYLKCSTCISITTNVDVATAMPNDIDYVDDYQASAGTVTISTLTATQITGTLNSITLRHVDNTTAGSVPNASGCTSTLASLAFTANVTTAFNPRVHPGQKRPLRVSAP
jgi:hypothetical protein